VGNKATRKLGILIFPPECRILKSIYLFTLLTNHFSLVCALPLDLTFHVFSPTFSIELGNKDCYKKKRHVVSWKYAREYFCFCCCCCRFFPALWGPSGWIIPGVMRECVWSALREPAGVRHTRGFLNYSRDFFFLSRFCELSLSVYVWAHN